MFTILQLFKYWRKKNKTCTCTSSA